MTLSVVFALLFYSATILLVVGVGRKIVIYARTPAPLKIPTTPAPTTRRGVVWRMTKEITVFQSLFKSDKWVWLFGWVFHAALALVLLRHLRYFQEPVWTVVALIQPFGKYAAFAMIFGLAGLWARRFLVDRVRYISTLSDHLMLALIIAIGLSGLGIKYIAHTDIIALKAYMMGLMYFDLQPLPDDGFVLVHLSLVITLMVIFPISKLLHVPGLFFMPTRTQVDNPREVRHTAGWTAK
ncbi:MAG: respiratory nitrate reductase subunit gamma [Ectothiorhodospiraceae bacterium]|nr:respiratory nitrate reductase subunit gamma [Ectothiorhodospiraceae bacterium]